MLNGQPKLGIFLASLLLVGGCLLACRRQTTATPNGVFELTIVDPSTGLYWEMQEKLEKEFTRQTGIRVRSVVASERTTAMFEEQRSWLRSGSDVPDVCFLDNVWAGSLADYLTDLSPELTQSERSDIIPAVLAAYLVDGRLIAKPRETNFPLLLYRTDLLKEYGFASPPETWDELERMALVIQAGERKKGNSNFWGYVWEGAATEALTCVGQEYQISSGGGHILEPDRTISVNNARAIRSFARAASWINRISPPGTSAYVEEDARNVWEAGNAAFARNWAEEYALSQSETARTHGRFSITVLPHDLGGHTASTVGGWGYGVSRHSHHPHEAGQLVRFLTSRAAQKWRLEKYSQLPSLTSLYSDPKNQDAVSFLAPIHAKLLSSAVARPSGLARDEYGLVSAAYANQIHAILTRKYTAAEGVARLEKELATITKFQPRPAQ